MKIYNLSDIHMNSRRNINRLDDIILNRVSRWLDKTVNKNSIVTIAGDILDTPLINSGKHYKCLKNFIDMMNQYSEYKNIKFMLIRGNHDYFHDIDENVNIGVLSLIESTSENKISVKTTKDLPNIIVAYNNDITVDILNEDLHMLLLPHGYDKNKFHQTSDMQHRILICHGELPNDTYDINLNDELNQDLLKKFDYIFKGHIHKKSVNELGKSKIYSCGSVVRMSSDDETGYIEYNSKTDECQIKDFNDKMDIKYINGIYNRDNINDLLKSIDDYSIVNILFTGSNEDIDPELFQSAYKLALDMRLIFENEVTNRLTSDDGNENGDDTFMSLDSYLKENLSDDIYSYIKELRLQERSGT